MIESKRRDKEEFGDLLKTRMMMDIISWGKHGGRKKKINQSN